MGSLLFHSDVTLGFQTSSSYANHRYANIVWFRKEVKSQVVLYMIFSLSQKVFSKLNISCLFEHLTDSNEVPIDCEEPFLPAPFKCVTGEIFT